MRNPRDVAVRLTTVARRVQQSRRRVAPSPYEVGATSGLMQMRRFFPGTPGGRPILLVPPLMAPSWVFDLHARRSMVAFLHEHGFSIYGVDWGEPGRDHARLDLATYTLQWLPRAVEAVTLDAGRPPLVVGYCLGGLFTAWYLALHPGTCPGLVLVASPIDTHRMGHAASVARMLWRPAELAGRVIGNVPGIMSSTVFQLSSPLRAVTRWVDLVTRMDDTAHIDEFAAMRAWMSSFATLPKTIYLQVLCDLLRDNRPFRGELTLWDRRVDLSRIDVPVLAIGGGDDKVVAPAAVHAIAEKVTTPVQHVTAPGGHASVIAGPRAPQHVWSPIVEWARRVDGADRGPPRAR